MLLAPIVGMQLMCSDAKRESFRDYFEIVSNGVSSFQLTTVSLEEKLKEQFEDLAGVGQVRMSKNGKTLSVQIEVTNFDRTTRRRIYATEREAYKTFPEYSFDFCLVDVSESPENAERV